MQVAGGEKYYLQHYVLFCYNSVNNRQTSKPRLSKRRWMQISEKKKKSHKVIDKHYYYAFAQCYSNLTLPFGCFPEDMPSPSETPSPKWELPTSLHHTCFWPPLLGGAVLPYCRCWTQFQRLYSSCPRS